MCRVRWFFALALLLAPEASQAIQLHWASGATDLSFTEATRCTLVVQADSASATLPAEWRLLWLADTSAVQFTALDSVLACQADTAQVSGIDGPSTPADSAANLITAHFCSGGANAAAAADYLVDLPGRAHGKLKAVALDPADSTQVIESNEATFNGGVEGDYPAVLLRVFGVHPSGELMVRAVGVGLASTQGLTLSPADTSWRLPLTIASRSDSVVVATAYLSVPLPPCNVEARGATGLTTASLPGDPPAELLAPLGSSARFVPDSGVIQPKDFAFFYQQQLGLFHIFYIRAGLKTA